MPRKTCKIFPKKLAQTILILLLAAGGGTVLSHQAASQENTPPGISPGQIQSWKDYIKSYPQRLAEYQQDQAARRKEVEEVKFSEESPEDIKKSYPFLYDPNDITPTEIAESRGKINLLFVVDTGPDNCGSHGCNETVYADEGTGYKPVYYALTKDNDPVYVARTGGQVFVYFGPPDIISSEANGLPAELILKDHQIVENQPPPREPDSPLYLKWRDFENHKNTGSVPPPALPNDTIVPPDNQ